MSWISIFFGLAMTSMIVQCQTTSESTLDVVDTLETPTKLLVVNGWSDNHKVPTEVLNLANPEDSCQLPDFPEDLIWSVGGYTEDGALVCSGRDSHTWSETNGCFLMDENSGVFVRTTLNLTFPRSLAGSVVTGDGELWLLGGFNAGQPLMTTELYGSIQTTDDLTLPLYGFCVVKINQTTAMVTGGSNGMSQRETYYIDFLTYTFSPGPPLTQARSRHGCTAFKNNGRTIGLVAGGWNPNLDTVEYLDLSQDNPSTWLPGPQIPSKLDDFVLINTNVGVLLLGGYDSTIIDYSHLIQQLVCNTNDNDIGNCEWQEFGQTLAMKQSSPVVIPIPSSLNLCQHAISTTSQPIEPSTTLAPPVVFATIPPQEDCSYCPECARPDYEQIGGSGSLVEIEKWPWIVSIGWENGTHWESYCTGSIISRHVILTANHCFFSKGKYYFPEDFEKRRKTKVRLGDQILNNNYNELDMARTYEINTVIGHPKYQGSGIKFDLALIFTKEPIQFNDRTKPICLPNQAYNLTDKYANQNAKIAGFGYFDGTFTASDDLRAADFKILSKDDCISQSLYRPRRRAHQHFFCAGNPNGRTWTCPGDSGAPLVKVFDSNLEQNLPFYKVLGTLHGSKLFCESRTNRKPRTHPSMFVNLDYSENLDFVYQWKDSLDPLIDALANQEDITQVVNLTTNLNLIRENGQNVLDQEPYNAMIHKTCMKQSTRSYNSKIMRNFGVNCTEFYSVAKKKCSEEGSGSVLCGAYNEMFSYQCSGQLGNTGRSNFGFNCHAADKGEFEQWSEWGDCSTTCGNGTRKRTRTCPAKRDCIGDSTQSEPCLDNPKCTSEFEEWSKWEDCSTTCGEGTRTRKRECPGPHECIGNSTQLEPCFDNPKCTSEFEEWSKWEDCSTTCGEVTRILVVTGWVRGGKTKKTEVWPKPESQCTLPDFHLAVDGAVGFWTAQGPMVCGGWRVNKCFLYKNHQWMPSTTMRTPRKFASALQINPNQAIIIGGYDGNGNDLKSTEVISTTGSEEGKDFPVTIYYHCSFKINSTHALVTGGDQDGSESASTWFVDLTTTRFTPGPMMTSRRYWHGCSTLQLGRKTFGVVAGGYHNGYLDSTEWIDLEEDSPTWTEGPKLPRGLERLTLVETTQGTYALGGYGNGYRSEVLKLDCPGNQIQSCQWQEMPEKLEVGRHSHVSLSLPESYDICN